MGSRRTIAAAVATVLTSTGLYPVFSGGSWFWAGVGAVASIAAAGTLTRLRRLPVPACLLGGLAGLLLYLNLVFAHGQSLAGVLPTPASLSRLWTLAGQGIGEAARYAPPVPELGGMVVLAAGGIGLTALLVDLIAVRLGSAALAGVPLLLLFTEPFTLSVSRGWLGTATVFCVAAAGFLTLLGIDGRERIREWERPQADAERSGADGLPQDSGPPQGGGLAQRGERPQGDGGLWRDSLPRVRPPDTSALASAGRRVGVASVLVALCVPLFVPGLHATRLFGGGSAGTGGGFPDPQTQVSKALRSRYPVPVLSYTSTASPPGYLQVYVLSGLTARGWQFSRPQALVPGNAMSVAPPGLTSASPLPLVTTRISIRKDAGHDSLVALPAPYPPVRVNVDGNVQADRDTLMLFGNGTQLAGLRYSVTSMDVSPSPQELSAVPPPPKNIADGYLDVPPSYAALRRLAQNITATATTPYAKAVALQDWFADGNFIYSLSAPPVTNAASLENFVDNTHSGYCQQFAFAMAVLARLLGIPSRVAYGFTQGTRQHDNSWLVTTHDSHAWPELYFQGWGWLRFEPTPGGADGQGTATTPAYTVPQTAPAGPAPSAPAPNPTGPADGGAGNGQTNLHDRQLLAGGGNGGTALPLPPPSGLNPWQLAGLSLLGLLAVAAVLPGCARAVIRRRRWRRAGARAGRTPGEGAPADRTSGEGSLADKALADKALAEAAWRELCDDLTDYRAGFLPSESPRALARRVTEELRLSADAAAALRRVTMAAERARYSARPADGSMLRRDSTTVRRALASSVPRGRRWLARVFPSSLVNPFVLTVVRVMDLSARVRAVGRMRAGAGRLRGRTAP